MKIFYLLFCILCLFSCVSKQKNIIQIGNCDEFLKRKTIKEISFKAIVLKKRGEYLLKRKGKSYNKQYYACNLSKEFFIDGLEVEIQGLEKKVFPYEKVIGLPLLLTEIKRNVIYDNDTD